MVKLKIKHYFNLNSDEECTFTPQLIPYPSKLLEHTTFEERNKKIIEKAEIYDMYY